MSVQKLITEAEKLLEKGKVPEGIAKFKQALQQEPLNQIVATKLAAIYVQEQDTAEAAKVYGALAIRLSEAGKSPVAIAIYKQALELSPDDMNLRVKFAQECESVGKLADAFFQGQLALQYYLKRKKYFDAANMMPMLARSQPKDEKIKLAWMEVLFLSQAEQKVVHFLVAICGPPGVLSQEFPVGGEPSTMSQPLYDGLKRLVPFFPRDPRIAYATAWAAYRRGRMKDFYHFLYESLRRDPDFSLSVLLLARVLAESQKLNEAMFAYKYFKDRIATDKAVDMLTLNRLIENFVEKNGWVKFLEDSGELLDAVGFLNAITGKGSVGNAAETKIEQETREDKVRSEDNRDLPPAEIELGGSSPDAGMEIVLATGQNISEVNKQHKAVAKDLDPLKAQAELIKAAIAATVAGIGAGNPGSQNNVAKSPEAASVTESEPAAIQAPLPAQAPEVASGLNNFVGDSVEFSALLKMREPTGVSKTAIEADIEPSLAIADATRVMPAALPQDPPAEEAKKNLFNPMQEMDVAPAKPGTASQSDRTVIFSPIDVLDAEKIMKKDLSEVETRSLDLSKVDNPEQKSESTSEVEKNKWKGLYVEGSPTQLYSPVEAVHAGVASRRPIEVSPQPITPPETPTSHESLETDGDPTRIMETPAPPFAPDVEPAAAPNEAALIPDPAPVEEAKVEAPAVAIVPIPELPAESALAEVENIDLGDDLLDGPTRIFTRPTSADQTEHLIKEIKKEIKEKAGAVLNIEMLMKKADRYTAKRNYYLARKALRHAQALGADEENIKNRLREIRKLEFPEGLYNTISSDRVGKVDTAEVLDRLEQEFDLVLAEESGSEALGSLVEARIEAIFQDNDPRTILDFGVGLQEMGLYRQAEELLLRLVEEFPDYSFDAYYLAAMSKISRRDFAGAASILKRLSSDTGKTEIEKIQIYYALGETFEKLRQPDRSKQFFKKVAELDANYRNVRHKLED